jgi:hypothetical protein
MLQQYTFQERLQQCPFTTNSFIEANQLNPINFSTVCPAYNHVFMHWNPPQYPSMARLYYLNACGKGVSCTSDLYDMWISFVEDGRTGINRVLPIVVQSLRAFISVLSRTAVSYDMVRHLGRRLNSLSSLNLGDRLPDVVLNRICSFMPRQDFPGGYYQRVIGILRVRICGFSV